MLKCFFFKENLYKGAKEGRQLAEARRNNPTYEEYVAKMSLWVGLLVYIYFLMWNFL